MKYITGLPNMLDSKTLSKKLEDVLESGVLTNNGPRVQELEELFEEKFGCPAVAYVNATAGLQALGHFIANKEIDIQSFTFIATATALKDFKLTFVDINDHYQSKVYPNGRQYLLTNLFGSCGSLNENVYYDNAHALGVKYNGKSVAQYGKASVFSLHSTKFLNGIEGGIVACPNDMVEQFKEFRNFGYKINSPKIYTGEIGSYGINAKMSELHATVALHHFNYLEHLIDLNKERYEWYRKWLPESCKLIEYPKEVSPNYSYIVVRVPAALRDKLCDFLYNEGVYVKQYFMPLHLLNSYLSNNHRDLKNTETIAKEVIALPQGIQLKQEKDVVYICKAIRQFFKDN